MDESNLKVVDLSYLKDMSDGESAIIKEMIDIFFTQVDEFIDEMKSLHEAKDWSGLGKLAHKAKSSVAIMGMNDLANDLKNFELLTKKQENIDEYKKYIVKFEEQCRLAVEELKLIYNSI